MSGGGIVYNWSTSIIIFSGAEGGGGGIRINTKQKIASIQVRLPAVWGGGVGGVG